MADNETLAAWLRERTERVKPPIAKAIYEPADARRARRLRRAHRDRNTHAPPDERHIVIALFIFWIASNLTVEFRPFSKTN